MKSEPDHWGAELAKYLTQKTVSPFVLKKLDYSWGEGKPARAEAEFYYLGLRDGIPMVSEFCKHLKRVLVPFCLPRSEIRAARSAYAQTSDESVFVDLSDKARGLFIKALNETKRSGEGGELILFNFLEMIGAPQIISKMYLKTASQMPVYGSDGLHIGPCAAPHDLAIYIGESKLHANYDNALGDALTSVTSLVNDGEKFDRELDLITDHIDTDTFSELFRKSLKAYLDPYSPEIVKRKDFHACLIGFDYLAYNQAITLQSPNAEEALIELAKAFAADKLANLAVRLAKPKYEKLNFLFFFLPVPSVEEFREKFNRIVLGVGDA